jgi:hypothetical protein
MRKMRKMSLIGVGLGAIAIAGAALMKKPQANGNQYPYTKDTAKPGDTNEPAKAQVNNPGIEEIWTQAPDIPKGKSLSERIIEQLEKANHDKSKARPQQPSRTSPTQYISSPRPDYYSLIRDIKPRLRTIPGARIPDYLNANLEKVISYWYGTPYSRGTTSTPKKGGIACGYFVSRVLKDVGYNIDQVTMGQQAGSTIINSVCDQTTIRKFPRNSLKRIKEYVKKGGEGFYVVGLDTHVGLLYNKQGNVYFIHSSSERPTTFSKRRGVVRQRPEDSWGFKNSGSYMIGKLFTGKSLDKYLSPREIPPEP